MGVKQEELHLQQEAQVQGVCVIYLHVLFQQ